MDGESVRRKISYYSSVATTPASSFPLILLSWTPTIVFPSRIIRLRLILARAALAWERGWPAAWPVSGAVGLFVAAALFGLPSLLPGWLHALLLAVAVALLGRWGRTVSSRCRWPGPEEAGRWLERRSGVPNRPLQAATDSLAAGHGDGVAETLWHRHQVRMDGLVGRVRLTLPRAGLATRDPLGLRVVVVLLVVISAVGTRGEWGWRLVAALVPDLVFVGGGGGGGGEGAPVVDAWITPPAYTGLPPMVLKPGVRGGVLPAVPAVPVGGAPLAVPVGSALLARVSAGTEAPVLEVGERRQSFIPGASESDRQGWKLTTVLAGGERISIVQGLQVLGSWPITMVADAPPEVRFTQPAKATVHGALQLSYQASDDFGLTGIAVLVRLDAAAVAKETPEVTLAAIETPEVTLTVPAGHPRVLQGTGYVELTAHPWAGLPVLVRLKATDGADQNGWSEEMALHLPARFFAQPVARDLIELRRRLILSGEGGGRGVVAVEVARGLTALATHPERFRHDTVVALALRVAAVRLTRDRAVDAVTSVVALLWDTALRVEDGGASLAERELRAAARALEQALEQAPGQGADEGEIRRRIEEVRRALDQYLAAMARQPGAMARGAQPPPTGAGGGAARTIDGEELRAMLNRLQDSAETGARDSARQTLSELRQILENLRTAPQGGGQGGGQGGDDQGLAETMSRMREIEGLAQRQRALIEQTYRETREPGRSGAEAVEGWTPPPGILRSPPPPPSPWSAQPAQPGAGPRSGRRGGERSGGGIGSLFGLGGGDGAKAAGQQDALRRDLGETMRKLGESGEIPGTLGQAERGMREATGALKRGEDDLALSAQSQSLEQLRQSNRELAKRLSEAEGGPGTGQGAVRDPLGRMGGRPGLNDDATRVPSVDQVRRARMILDELRRRAGEFQRPRPERDYIERLLRRF
ncbi:TIGR02302 family protein [uncultured Gammaproteobacteria bacterium]